MATHQDCWPNHPKQKNGDKKARQWLTSLEIGAELLHAPPNVTYNLCDPSGKEFQTVSIKSIHSDHVIVAYPNLASNWDRKLPFKYAFAARPIDQCNHDNDTDNEEENLSQSSSDASIVTPEHTVPFPPNIKNEKDKISFTFDKKRSKKKALSTFRSNNNTFLNDDPPPSRECTPPKAARSTYNILHDIRERETTSPKLKKTYADSRGSKNRRNRAIAANSEKRLGHIIKNDQRIAYQEKQRKQREKEKKEKEEEEEKEELSKHCPPWMKGRYPPCIRERQQGMRYYKENEENMGPMTRNRCRQQRQKQYISPNRSTPDWLKTPTSLKEPIGLQNMGNTCFMNSTLQSLIHTEELRSFFLNNSENKWFTEQLNTDNPIGYGGKIALSFSNLVSRQCNESHDGGYYASIKPSVIHYNLTGTLRQFADYRQHDAQEFMTNFLDGLHEDLNRIKKKKYMEIPDFDAKDEEGETKLREFLHKRWHNIYLKRNNSVCTDLFAGLLKSTVTCPLCDFTAITFDPFMHLLVPLKAPKSMLRDTIYNKYNGYKEDRHRGRFDASEDEDVDVLMEDKYKQLMFYLFPKDTDDASLRVIIQIKKEIEEEDDWTTLHATIYDYLIKNYGPERDQAVRRQIGIHRAQMIKSPEFHDDEHIVYYGLKDVDAVKQCYDNALHYPKQIKAEDICPFPMFKCVELHQENNVLDFASICSTNYNVKISDYLLGTGHKRLCVQQIPSHWTDPQKMNVEDQDENKIKCYIVFRKPKEEDKEDDDDDDMDILGGKTKEERTDWREKEKESEYEPFSYPRIIFDKGLTSKLDESLSQQYLHKKAKELVLSIAGDKITDHHLENEMEIRFCRNMDEYSLDKIDKWSKVMMNPSNTNNSNSNSNKPKPIQSMVIIFSFEMHQIYTKYQRKKEEKRVHHEQRGKQENNARKRSFQAMNGGNIKYNDDSLNTMPRKRQRRDNYHSDYHEDNNTNNNNNEDHDMRDTSLPLEFQPTETKAQTIKQCFGIFLSREQLGRDNKWFCKKCKDHVQGRKKLDLWWLPSHLIIAIKRFDNHGLRKYSDYVKYPVEGLDLTHIIRGRDSLDVFHNEHDAGNNSKSLNNKRKNEKFVYDLYAVINHSGSLNFGHYTATIKFGNRWYNISDSSVGSCSNPITSQAYILCYKKQQQQ